MPINKTPPAGTVFYCDYSGAIPPEMAGAHYVIVISSKPYNRQKLCVVVPITSSKSNPVPDFHISLKPGKFPFIDRDSWIKPNLVKTVSHQRLSNLPDRLGGQSAKIDKPTLDAIKQALKEFLAIP